MKKHQEDSLLLNSRFMAYWEDLIVGLKIKGSEMSSSYALQCIPAVHVHQLCLTQNQWVTKWFSSLVSFLSGVVPQHVIPHTVGFGEVNRLVIVPRDGYSIKWLFSSSSRCVQAQQQHRGDLNGQAPGLWGQRQLQPQSGGWLHGVGRVQSPSALQEYACLSCF